jgi:hypothetical protein
MNRVMVIFYLIDLYPDNGHLDIWQFYAILELLQPSYILYQLHSFFVQIIGLFVEFYVHVVVGYIYERCLC